VQSLLTVLKAQDCEQSCISQSSLSLLVDLCCKAMPFVLSLYLEDTTAHFMLHAGITSPIQLQVVLIYCWWFFDLQVCLQQCGIASAKFRFVDNANWDLAWSAISSMDCIKYDKVDLEGQDQVWWHQLAQAQIIVGWYVHEVLTDKLDESMLEKLVENGAIVLLGCTATG